MSRSFHVTQVKFRNCSKRQLDELAADEYSGFVEWAFKRQVKRTTIEKRRFARIFCELVEDENLSDDELARFDDREYFYNVLHTRLFANLWNKETQPETGC